MSEQRGVYFEKGWTKLRLGWRRFGLVFCTGLLVSVALFFMTNGYFRLGSSWEEKEAKFFSLKHLPQYMLASARTHWIADRIRRKDLNIINLSKKELDDLWKALRQTETVNRFGKILNFAPFPLSKNGPVEYIEAFETVNQFFKYPPNKFHMYKGFRNEMFDDEVEHYYWKKVFFRYTAWQVCKPFVLSMLGFVFVFLGGMYIAFLKKTASKKHERGSRLLKVKELSKAMMKDGKKVHRRLLGKGSPSRINMSGLHIPRLLLSQHMELFGDTGTGKTTVIKWMLRNAQFHNESCIVYDIEGELTQEFYDEERGDIILDVEDPNCPYWSPWSEIETEHDKETFLLSVMPDDPKDPFWTETGRVILSAIMEKLDRGDEDVPKNRIKRPSEHAYLFHKPDKEGKKKTSKQTKDFHDVWDLLNLSTKELYEFLQDTDANNIMSPALSGQDQGQITHLKKDIRFLKFLPHDDGRRHFSCKEWVKNPKGWIFLRRSERSRAVMSRLISIWVDCLSMHLLSREGDNLKPIHFVVDELHSLKRLNSFVELLIRVRKRGVSILFGTQNVGQLREIYGREIAQTMLSMPVFKMIFRTSEPESAKYCSSMIGDREINQVHENLSAGVKDFKDGLSYNTQTRKEELVLPSDIQALQDLEGYFIYGKAGTSKVKITIPPAMKKAPSKAKDNTVKDDGQKTVDDPVAPPVVPDEESEVESVAKQMFKEQKSKIEEQERRKKDGVQEIPKPAKKEDFKLGHNQF